MRTSRMFRFLLPVLLVMLSFIAVDVLPAETPGTPPQGAEKEGKAVPAGETDVMHPPVTPLDAQGNILAIADTAKMDQLKTCGQCHDTAFINSHNSHINKAKGLDVNCAVCHLKGGKIEENQGPIHLSITQPTNQHCGQCHGLVHDGKTPLTVPHDFARLHKEDKSRKPYNITRQTGVVNSPQDLAESAMNLKSKKDLHFPWDVHARRQLDCIDCHFIGNDPRFCGNLPANLGHLKMDPRKIKSPGEILKRPDHQLKTAACTCCHEPLAAHKSLPYRKRHMDVLACQSCHVPSIHGPAFRAVDSTVVTADGGPRIEYRGESKDQSHGDSLNTKFLAGFQPALFPHVNKNPNDPRDQIISPFNLVTYWSWRSAKTKEAVPAETVKEAFLTGNNYRPEILKALDKNNDNRLDASELVLDTPEKIQAVKNNLKAAGVQDPEIIGVIKAFKVDHGIRNAKHMKRDCSYCHGEKSTFGNDVILALHAPAGIVPLPERGALAKINGSIEKDQTGALFLARGSEVPGHYVFGHSRMSSLDNIGFWIFILSLLGAMFHGGLRFLSARKHPPHRSKTRKVYMYRFYERLWHWTMATGIIVLALTGLEIHYAGSFTIFGLETSVHLHNILAGILIFNAALSLFYHLATGEIKQFFRFNRKFIHETLVQVWYYIYGIFKGKPHPIQKTRERKLNPLQQLTYVVLLNILLPFQVITGMLIMAVGKWPAFAEKVGGLTVLGPVHNLGSWLFIAFLAVHIYLTTTGHTVLSNMKAMVTGYDEVAEDEPPAEHMHLMDMKVMDLVGTLIGKKQEKQEKQEKQTIEDKPTEKGGK